LARALGGRVLLRVEDHDRGRCRAEYEAGLLEDLAWLGFVPDNADRAVWRQSLRNTAYEEAMRGLGGAVYPCVCSRRELDAAAGSSPNAETRYPGTCRARGIDPSETTARRVVIEPGAEPFVDVIQGQEAQDPSDQCGDVLIRDRSGNWTYQFAVTVDDVAQNIDVVIRGTDLLSSTGRQIRIARLLGRASPPVYLHHPLIVRADGTKLSKSDGATGIRELRAAGWTPQRVLEEAGRLLRW
jgi:glutamyl-tRNA synthetase/glutamyl-Q tRNA(Asp) synthetase